MSLAHGAHAAAYTMTQKSPEIVKKINRNTVGMFRLVVLSYAVDFLLLAGLAFEGNLSGIVVGAYGIAALFQNSLFYLLVKTGINRSFKDPGMTVEQILFAVLVQTGFLIVAPEVGVVFLVNLFSVFMFGVLAFNARQFILCWGVCAAVTAGAFFYIGDRIGFPSETALNQVIMWTLFMLALGKTIYLASVISTLRLKVSEKNQALTLALTQMEEMATHDALTSVLNRRAMLVAMDAEFQVFKRKKTPFCIAVMDLDHFKQINDTFGHSVGDEVLIEFAGILQQGLRVTDRVSRYGGDEFVVLLTDTPCDTAVMVLERICARVTHYDWSALAPGISVTVSIGVAEITERHTIMQTFERADNSLYQAKQAGRNGVHAACGQVVA
jgi:diguanylate cyclase (GGDEF)-like protein